MKEGSKYATTGDQMINSSGKGTLEMGFDTMASTNSFHLEA